MMGYQHFLSGAATWLAVARPLADATGMTPGETFVGGAVCVGATMLPDLDKPGSTIGRTYGPVTNVLARGIALIAQGHREGTHSLVGVAAFTGLAYLAAAHGGPLRYVLLWIILGVAARAAGLAVPAHRSITAVLHAVMMGAATLAVLASDVRLLVPLTVGVAVGTALHVAGDMLTPERCPLLWPFSKARFGVGVVTTGNRWSSPVVTLVLALTVAWLVLPPEVRAGLWYSVQQSAPGA